MKIATFILMASLLCMISCEESDKYVIKSDEKTLITATKEIKKIEWNGDGNERVILEDDLQLIITNAEIWIQRPSCSGFNRGSVRDASSSDIVEYTYYSDDSDLANRKITAITVRFFKYECVYPESNAQWIYDGDKDGYTDNIDAFPDDPTRH